MKDSKPQTPEFLTPEEVAEKLKVTRRTVYNWLRSGALPGLKVGPRSWRIDTDDLRRFLTRK